MFVLLPSLTQKFLGFQSIKCQTIGTHNNFRHCRVHFYAFVRQPFSKQLYTLLTKHRDILVEYRQKKKKQFVQKKCEGDILPVGSRASLVNKRCITRLKMFIKKFPIITDWGKAHNSDRQPTRRIITSGVKQTIEKGSFMFKESFLRNLSHTTTKQFQN